GQILRRLIEISRTSTRMVLICEGNMDNTLRAAVMVAHDGICHPVVLGYEEMIEKRAARLGLSLDGVEIVNPRHDREAETRERYAMILAKKKSREGFTFDFALEKMYDRTYFGMMMVETGDADACLASTYSAGEATASNVVSIIGLQEGFNHFATMHILNTRSGSYFIADTAVNPDADKDALVDIARLADKTVRFFAQEPVAAMLSYSNFGSSDHEEATLVAEAVSELHEKYPQIQVDGEMQLDYALDTKLRDKTFPFNTIKGKDVNTLIFPNLTAANTTCKMLLSMGVGSIIGPIQMGLKKPVYFTNSNSSEREIVDLVTIAALDAIVLAKQ
ncbi:MAG: NADP-dependent malic enzyme, partial [Muribaculaceae bacterium]|nr:NADP-dependent malic enzyme [Muribaculaceae bacterium]